MRHHHHGHNKYMASKLIACDCRPTQKNIHFERDFRSGSTKRKFKAFGFLIVSGDSNGLMIINELLLSLRVQWGHIKNLTISKMEGLLHFENIKFQGKANYMHWYHLVEKDVHPSFALGKHFILLQNRCGVDLVHLDNLNCLIKR